MASLTYVEGDATKPVGEGHKVIPHITNDIGAWGSGFVVALSKMWGEPEQKYRADAAVDGLRLGEVQFVPIPDDGIAAKSGLPTDRIVVANMCAQHGIRPSHQPGAWQEAENGKAILRPPIRYGALSKCMQEVRRFCRADGQPWASIHAPKFGSGLAGGDWTTIEAMILEHWVDYDIDVTVYEFAP